MDKDRLQKQYGIIGNSEVIQQVIDLIMQVGRVDITVLVTGESGTGKELIAKAVHGISKRNQKEMITVNCGAIPEGIIESELFGHTKGSYTGAGSDRKGYFESAHKGTIFLDEIGEMPLDTQVKVLRVLESGEFMRVGDSKTLYTDVRVIAATNKKLESLVKENRFREDLFYRLKTVTIDIPPLRNRVEDISLLVERFALLFSRSNDILYRGFMPEAVKRMKQHDWQGNVRELKHFVERILVLEKGERITADMVEGHLSPSIIGQFDNAQLPIPVVQSPESAERELILRQLFLLRQDVESIKQLLGSRAPLIPAGEIDHFPRANQSIDLPGKIDEHNPNNIRGEAIGEANLQTLERELIVRTLKFHNNNRRATAKTLGMSERTLYRKINEYGIEPKIKKSIR
ncbi:MAG: sigma-54-dependent Fis family transcriptional regulator [Candidatus Marinimicrobia bacterium]|nr:sigma-54-dependent Fis family transcriptional regulator [Candidatus Neomarinimicrobiota bacterium]|tara:strand:+ start:30913 stop:32118 length:1206 start_codon:yes stop_codon:yes gene_type:complete